MYIEEVVVDTSGTIAVIGLMENVESKKEEFRGKNSLLISFIHCEYIYIYIHKSQSNIPKIL